MLLLPPLEALQLHFFDELAAESEDTPDEEASVAAMDEKDDDTDDEDDTSGTWLTWSKTGDMVIQGWLRISSKGTRS